MDEKSDKKKDSGFTDSTIGIMTTENIERYGRASSEYIKGYKGEIAQDGTVLKKGLKQVYESKVNPDFRYQNIKQQAGFSAEIHYVDKENANSIINKTNKTIYRSNDLGRGNDPEFDVLSIDENGNPIVIPIDEYAQDIVDKNFEENYEKGYYATGVLIIPEEENEKDDTSDTTQNG